MTYSFSVWQGGMKVASANALKRVDAWKEAKHYAAMYAQDGPAVTIKERNKVICEVKFAMATPAGSSTTERLVR